MIFFWKIVFYCLKVFICIMYIFYFVNNNINRISFFLKFLCWSIECYFLNFQTLLLHNRQYFLFCSLYCLLPLGITPSDNFYENKQKQNILQPLRHRNNLGAFLKPTTFINRAVHSQTNFQDVTWNKILRDNKILCIINPIYYLSFFSSLNIW